MVRRVAGVSSHCEGGTPEERKLRHDKSIDASENPEIS